MGKKRRKERAWSEFGRIAARERAHREQFGEVIELRPVQSSNYPDEAVAIPEDLQESFWNFCSCRGHRAGCGRCTEGADPPRHLRGKALLTWYEELARLRARSKKSET